MTISIAKAILMRKAKFSIILSIIDKLGGMAFPGNDFDQNIVETYVEQCCAEAQEVRFLNKYDATFSIFRLQYVRLDCRFLNKCDATFFIFRLLVRLSSSMLLVS